MSYEVVSFFIHQRGKRNQMERAVRRNQHATRIAKQGAHRLHDFFIRCPRQLLDVRARFVAQSPPQFLNRFVNCVCLIQFNPLRFALLS